MAAITWTRSHLSPPALPVGAQQTIFGASRRPSWPAAQERNHESAALTFVVMDWWIGYWTTIVRQRAKNGLVVFDRHLLDVLVDPLRYRYAGPLWLVRAMCRLVPRPDVIAVLDAVRQ